MRGGFTRKRGCHREPGASLETTYQVRLVPQAAPGALLQELNKVEGVHGVQLRVLDGNDR